MGLYTILPRTLQLPEPLAGLPTLPPLPRRHRLRISPKPFRASRATDALRVLLVLDLEGVAVEGGDTPPFKTYRQYKGDTVRRCTG